MIFKLAQKYKKITVQTVNVTGFYLKKDILSSEISIKKEANAIALASKWFYKCHKDI